MDHFFGGEPVSELRRATFGPKSEKLSPEQYNLPLEDVEIAQGVLDAAQEKAETVLKGKSDGEARPRRRNRGRLPAHLPRVERVIEPESRMCPCGEMAKIGEDVSERLDMIPAQFRVLVTRRPKYACRRCSRAVVQAHAPEHVVPGGLPTERLIAQVIVSKFGDHVPFYRQADIYSRQGVTLDRATLGNWAGLTRFLEDGRLELDTNPVENAIRPVALTRKNALFAGHEVGAENWALLASIVATCKLNDANPVDYIAETLCAILNGHPQSRIEQLMPWRFRKASTPNA